jgi:RecA-family ATPase
MNNPDRFADFRVVRDRIRAEKKAEPPPNGQAKDEAAPSPIAAKPYIYRDPRSIPTRQFLHAGHYIRGFLSATIAPGGLGKTSLQLVEAIGMATGRDLLKGTTSPCRLKVWYWNLEDPRDETDRRIAAIVLHYRIKPTEIDEHLFINSEEPLVVATRIRDATAIAEPVVNGLISEITRLQIDALIIDPFVSSHKVPENDNNAIDTVAKTWSVQPKLPWMMLAAPGP